MCKGPAVGLGLLEDRKKASLSQGEERGRLRVLAVCVEVREVGMRQIT